MCGAVGLRGRKRAPSRDALRGILQGDAKCALDRALPAPVTAIHMRSSTDTEVKRVSAQLSQRYGGMLLSYCAPCHG